MTAAVNALTRIVLISFRFLWIRALAILTRAGRQRLAQAEAMVVFDPGMRNGIPTIKGTRVGVYEAAGFAKMEGIDVTLEHYLTLNREMVELAIIYAKAHPVFRRYPRRRNIPGRRLVSRTFTSFKDLEKQAGSHLDEVSH